MATVDGAVADSTIKGTNAAIAKFDEFQKHRSDGMVQHSPFVTMSYEEIEGDNFDELFLGFANFLVRYKGLIPKTKQIYFGKVKDCIKQKFASYKHPVFEDTSESWHSDLLRQIGDGASRLDFLNEDADGRNEPKCLPFYMKVENEYIRRANREAIMNNGGKEAFAIDGESLCLRLLKMMVGVPQYIRGPAQQRVWYVLCALAVGRAGEIKFQRYNEWCWDELFDCVDATWNEEKTLSHYSMLFGPSKYSPTSYLTDFFHAFGTFFVVENGLGRGPAIKALHRYHAFPQLRDNKVEAALRVTNVLRKHVHPDLQSKYSSRSIRKGQTTFLSLVVSDAALEFRGGWNAVSNSRSYREDNVSLSAPALYAMGGWKDTKGKKVAPCLESLGSHAQDMVESFQEELYTIEVDLFESGGRLRPFLRACTASLLMYFADTKRQFGMHHELVRRLVEAAEKSKIHETGCPDALSTLLLWGSKIKIDFQRRNLDSPSPGEASYVEIANIQNGRMQEICADNQQMKADMSSLYSVVEKLVDVVHTLKASLCVRRSPSRPASRVSMSPQEPDPTNANAASTRKRAPGTVDDAEAVEAVEHAHDTVEAAEATEAVEATEATIPLSKKVKHSASMEVGMRQTTGGVTVATLLDNLYRPHGSGAAGGLHGDRSILRGLTCSMYKEPTKQKACFELVELVISPAQWEILTTPGLSNKVVQKTTEAVQEACMKRMLQLERADGGDNGEDGDDNDKSRGKPFYTGLGARVAKYKAKHKDLDLMVNVGKPKQTNTIKSMFGPKKT